MRAYTYWSSPAFDSDVYDILGRVGNPQRVLSTRRVLMTGEGIDLVVLVADDALIARVRAAHAPGQLGTELERLLVQWRLVCPTTGSQRR